MEQIELTDTINALLIEDNNLYAQAIKTILESDNIKVTYLNNAEDASAFLTKEEFDIILLDVMLGDNMSGFEFLQILKKDIRYNQIPVIVLSALVQEEKIYEGLSLGAMDYLVKPFRANELLLKVRNYTKHNRSRASIENISVINDDILNLDFDYQLSTKFVNLINDTVKKGSYITIKEIVKKLNTNTSKLDTIVKKYHQTTPVKYILIKRLNRADLLIRNSNVSIINISAECGFKSVTYFCTAYKRLYGKTPLEARKS